MSFRPATGAGQDDKTTRRRDDKKMNDKPDSIERRSRDTRPQPAWRGADPATPCKAAQPPPPPAMKRLALLLPLLALLLQ